IGFRVWQRKADGPDFRRRRLEWSSRKNRPIPDPLIQAEIACCARHKSKLRPFSALLTLFRLSPNGGRRATLQSPGLPKAYRPSSALCPLARRGLLANVQSSQSFHSAVALENVPWAGQLAFVGDVMLYVPGFRQPPA